MALKYKENKLIKIFYNIPGPHSKGVLQSMAENYSEKNM